MGSLCLLKYAQTNHKPTNLPMVVPTTHRVQFRYGAQWMTVPELAEPRTGNGTARIESSSGTGPIEYRTGTGRAQYRKWDEWVTLSSSTGKLRDWVLYQMEIFRKWNSKKDSTGNGGQYWKWECQFQYWQIARLGTYISTKKVVPEAVKLSV